MVVDYHYATMSRHWCKRSRTRRMAVLCRRSLCFAFFHVPTKMLLNVCSWYIEFVSNLALWCGQQHSRFLPTRRFLSVSCVSSELLDGSPLVPRLYTRFVILLTGFPDVLGDGVALLCSIGISVHQFASKMLHHVGAGVSDLYHFARALRGRLTVGSAIDYNGSR